MERFFLFVLVFLGIFWMDFGMLGLGFLTDNDLTRRYPLLPYPFFDMLLRY